MLTAELVMARQRSGKLFVPPLGDSLRARALELAEAYLSFARQHVGRTREAFLETCRQVVLGPQERKLGQGLLKLVLDRTTFREDTTLDSAAVRRALFEAATKARRAGHVATGLREEVISAVAAEMGTTPEALEQALYADLPAAHVLEAAPVLRPEHLVDGYEMAQWQAVLLRAVEVRARIFCASPEALRALFRKLKFLGLSHRTETVSGPRGRVEHQLTLDGPFSLFESVTRYGLALGLALPAIAACDVWSLDADLRWGPARTRLSFSLAGKGPQGEGPTPPASSASGTRSSRATAGEPPLRDEVAQLLARLRDRERAPSSSSSSLWRAEIATDVLELPGVGVCVPDLALCHQPSGTKVLVEVLGFWSREAVFKRLDLVRAGLARPIVFVASRHLRVSEGLLDDVEHAALYVFAKVISVEALLERAEAVCQAWKSLAPASSASVAGATGDAPEVKARSSTTRARAPRPRARPAPRPRD